MSLLNSAYSHFEFLSTPETGWQTFGENGELFVTYNIDHPEPETGYKGGKEITAIHYNGLDVTNLIDILENVTGQEIHTLLHEAIQ